MSHHTSSCIPISILNFLLLSCPISPIYPFVIYMIDIVMENVNETIGSITKVGVMVSVIEDR